MSELAAIAYKSRATTLCTDIDLYYLLAQARARNLAAALSGVLLYDRGFFFQWLEGPIEAVHQVWSSIRRDSRHREIDVTYDDRRDSRLFEGWHMQLAHRDEQQQQTVHGSITFDARHLDALHDSPHDMSAFFASLRSGSGKVRDEEP